MDRELDLAEAKGHFRRLTKEEDIGWQTPWEIATTHLRHKEIPRLSNFLINQNPKWGKTALN